MTFPCSWCGGENDTGEGSLCSACEVDDEIGVCRDLLGTRLQRSANKAADSMHETANGVLSGRQLTKEDVREVERAYSDYQKSLDLLRRVVLDGGDLR